MMSKCVFDYGTRTQTIPQMQSSTSMMELHSKEMTSVTNMSQVKSIYYNTPILVNLSHITDAYEISIIVVDS